MNETSRELLKVALDRGYLEPDVVRRVAREAKVRRVSPERVLLERRVLSVRRMERLRSHLRYRVTRRSDKAYAEIALRQGLVSKRDLRAALKYQKTLFAQDRRCMRVGSRLIEKGLISLEDDRRLRAAVRGREHVPSDVAKANGASSTQALPLDEESALRSQTPEIQRQTSYHQIEAALARVEAIRALRDDLSTTDQAMTQEMTATPDSACEVENALVMLARARVTTSVGAEAAAPSEPRRPRPSRKRKKSGLAALLDRGAA